MNDRQKRIQKLINENGEIKLAELEKLFPEVSSMTIRRDLEKLEEHSEIVRTRCGAKSIAYLARLKEAVYSDRTNENVREKAIIAQKAYRLIEQGYSVFLDSGTTVTDLAKLFAEDKLFITTAAPNIALECAKKPNISVFMTGGQMNNDNLSLSGMNALSFLDNINIDIAFMASSGFSFKNSFTSGNFEECRIKKRIIEKAAKVVMLMDSTKFGKSLPFTFANLSDLDFFITDDNMDAGFLKEAKKYKVEIR